MRPEGAVVNGKSLLITMPQNKIHNTVSSSEIIARSVILPVAAITDREELRFLKYL